MEGNTLKLSSIFKWYREDFEKGWLEFHALEDFLLAHEEALALPPTVLDKLRTREIDIEYLDYDWKLNAKR